MMVQEKINCINGCMSENIEVLSGGDLLFGKTGTWSVVKCRACSLMWTNPRPTKDEIHNFYPNEYAPYINDKQVGPINKKKIGKFIKKILKVNIVKSPSKNNNYALEIGCAAGSYLNYLKSNGWDVEGVELNPTAAARAIDNGHKVFIGQLSNFPKADKKYDLIVGWMVVEHLHDPIADLRFLYTILKDSGELVISVPNAGSLQFKIFSYFWFPLQLPTHLFHFDKNTITLVLNKAGFEVNCITDQLILDDILSSIALYLKAKGFESIGNAIVAKTRQWTILRYSLIPLSYLCSKLNLTGRMTVQCKKMK
jgi:SAM-dependent methyltransferase